jgi:hypothetical protein
MQQGHPLASISKALGPRIRGLSVYEKEYLAILITVSRVCDNHRSKKSHPPFRSEIAHSLAAKSIYQAHWSAIQNHL